MGGFYGVENSKVVVSAVASVLNTGSKLIRGNVLALFELLGPFNLLSSVKWDVFKSELGELDNIERTVLEQAFSQKLDLVDKVVQQKIIDGANSLNIAVDIVAEAISVVNHAKELVERFKRILGV